jgi:hypothetical protein
MMGRRGTMRLKWNGFGLCGVRVEIKKIKVEKQTRHRTGVGWELSILSKLQLKIQIRDNSKEKKIYTIHHSKYKKIIIILGILKK